MYDILRYYLREKAVLSEDELERIEAAAVRRRLRRRQVLLQEGEINRTQSFICKGCVRQFRVDEKGVEHIIRFATESSWIVDPESFSLGTPAKSKISCLTDVEVLQWSKENFEKLQDEIPAFRQFHDDWLVSNVVAASTRVFQNISLTTEEKYAQFLATYPGLINRIPLGMVASYLGVATKTLTRLRSPALAKPSLKKNPLTSYERKGPHR
jgi:CRP-like cAMP-binding protein